MTLSQQQLNAACDEAKKQGLRTLVDAYKEAVRAATLAGCTEIEHGTLAPDDLKFMAKRGGVKTPGPKMVFGTDAVAGAHGRNAEEFINRVLGNSASVTRVFGMMETTLSLNTIINRMMSQTSPKNRKRAVPNVGPVPQIIARLPRPYPASAEEVGTLVTNELVDIWKSILSESEIREFQWQQKVSKPALEKLDALILKQAETLGWRLGLSPLVHWRFSEWDVQSNGPTLFERYGKALAKSALIAQKRALPPIDDPELYRVKLQTVAELRQLLRNMRRAFSKRRSSPSLDEMLDHFQKTVSADGDAFPYLKTNLNSWLKYIRAHSTSIKVPLRGTRSSPATLFDAWLAWSKGMDPETIRQTISDLGKLSRGSHNP